jgi:hypothetical protein
MIMRRGLQILYTLIYIALYYTDISGTQRLGGWFWEAGGGFNKGIDSERQERHPKRREEGFDEAGGRIKRGMRRDSKRWEDGTEEAGGWIQRGMRLDSKMREDGIEEVGGWIWRGRRSIWRCGEIELKTRVHLKMHMKRWKDDSKMQKQGFEEVKYGSCEAWGIRCCGKGIQKENQERFEEAGPQICTGGKGLDGLVITYVFFYI